MSNHILDNDKVSAAIDRLVEQWAKIDAERLAKEYSVIMFGVEDRWEAHYEYFLDKINGQIDECRKVILDGMVLEPSKNEHTLSGIPYTTDQSAMQSLYQQAGAITTEDVMAIVSHIKENIGGGNVFDLSLG